MPRSRQSRASRVKGLSHAKDHVIPRFLGAQNVDNVLLQIVGDRASILLVREGESAGARLFESGFPQGRLPEYVRIQPEEQVQVEYVSGLRLGAEPQRADFLSDHADRAVTVDA